MEVLLRMRKLDLLSPQVAFTVGGDSGIKTMFGTMMTGMYMVAITIFSYLIMLTFFSTVEPSIANEYSEGDVYSRVDLAKEKIVPVVYLFDNAVAVPADQYLRYVTPIFVKYRFSLVKAADGTISTDIFIKTMNVVPCSLLNPEAYQYYKGYEDSKYFKTYANLTGLCVDLDPKEAYVEGGGTDTSVDILTYSFFPCSLPAGCVSKEQLREVSMIFAMPTVSTNYSNYEEPVRSVSNADNFYYINDKLIQKYQHKFMTNEIFDDRGVLFEKHLRRKYSSVDRVMMNSKHRTEGSTECPVFNLLTCKEYFNFEFMSSSRKQKVVRTYKSLTKTMSEIGGINSILLLCFIYLNLVYIHFRKRRIFTERIFDFSNTTAQLAVGKPAAASSGSGKEKSAQAKKLYDQADTLIREGLDVVNIIKEINNIKVVSHLLFKNYHRKLLPLVAISLKKKPDDLSPLLKQIGEPMNLQDAISLLRENSTRAANIPPEKQSLEDRIDTICWQLLFHGESNTLDKSGDNDESKRAQSAELLDNISSPLEFNQIRDNEEVRVKRKISTVRLQNKKRTKLLSSSPLNKAPQVVSPEKLPKGV